MSIVRRALWAGVAGLAIAVGSTAQDKKDAPAGDDITSGFRAFVIAEPRFPAEDVRNAAGNKRRNPVDLVGDHALEPTIAIFSRTIPADATHATNRHLSEGAVTGNAAGGRAPASGRSFQRNYRPRRISFAAFHPAAPMTPPPGCAAEPHRNSPLTGVR